MDTSIALLKKARDEVQALIDGSRLKLSADVISWIRQDMSLVSDYTMPLMHVDRDNPAGQYELRDAVTHFRNFGSVPNTETVGGRMFAQKILGISLSRLNRMLDALGEQKTPDGSEDLMFKKLGALKTKQKLIPQLSPKTARIGKSLAELWRNGKLKAAFEADVRANEIRTADGLYFARDVFEELIDAGALQVSRRGAGRVSVSLLPQLKSLN